MTSAPAPPVNTSAFLPPMSVDIRDPSSPKGLVSAGFFPERARVDGDAAIVYLLRVNWRENPGNASTEKPRLLAANIIGNWRAVRRYDAVMIPVIVVRYATCS